MGGVLAPGGRCWVGLLFAGPFGATAAVDRLRPASDRGSVCVAIVFASFTAECVQQLPYGLRLENVWSNKAIAAQTLERAHIQRGHHVRVDVWAELPTAHRLPEQVRSYAVHAAACLTNPLC